MSNHPGLVDLTWLDLFSDAWQCIFVHYETRSYNGLPHTTAGGTMLTSHQLFAGLNMPSLCCDRQLNLYATESWHDADNVILGRLWCTLD